MKTFTILLPLTLATLTLAQEQCAAVAAKVPTCATSCIQSALPEVGCPATDFACQCKSENTAKINSAALECVLSSCGPVTGLAVQASASAVCACAATAAPIAAVETTAAAGGETTEAAPSPTSTDTAAVVAEPVASTAAAAEAPKASAETFTGGVAGAKAVLSMVGVVGGFVGVLAIL